METAGRLRLADVFVSIHDSRQSAKVKHDLVELLAEAVNAVLVAPTRLRRSNCGPKKSWNGCAAICKLQKGLEARVRIELHPGIDKTQLIDS